MANSGWRRISTSGRAGSSAPDTCADPAWRAGRKARIIAPTAASPTMAANDPANITGASISRVKITTCGPSMAVMMPPASTKEIARALKAGGALSAAAKRNCCTNAPPKPSTSSPKLNSRNEAWKSPRVATAPPIAVMPVPVMKPARWPICLMIPAAGMAPTATPTVNAVTGMVASDLSASRR